MRQDLRSCAFCHGRGFTDMRSEDRGLDEGNHVEAIGWTVLRTGGPWVFPRCAQHMIDDWTNSVFIPVTLEEISVSEVMAY